MQNMVKREIEEKEGLLNDIEEPVDLKLNPLEHFKKCIIRVADYSLRYPDAAGNVFENMTFTIEQGERVFINGENGCGKSSFVKALLRHGGYEDTDGVAVCEGGTLEVASNLIVSYISQDTSFLKGSLGDYAKKKNLDYSLLLTLLRQLDFDRVQFDKKMEDYSEGQKKKVLIASSLMTPAHLYIWDEPLNYVDVFSRMQIERLILKYEPTMLLIEHDEKFREKIATKIIEM